MGTGTRMKRFPVVGLLILVLEPCIMTACGVVGPPVPPEMVGVTPVIERQKRLESQGAAQAPVDPVPGDGTPFVGPVGQDEVLPPLRPIGTR
jgi:hypothetical protein